MQRLDEEIRSGKWLKHLDARIRPALAKLAHAEEAPLVDEAGDGPKDPYAEHLGVRFVHSDEDKVVAELDVATRHLNHQGAVHGGVLFAMAESVLVRASNSHGVSATPLDVSVSWVAPARVGDRLTAVAEEVALRRRSAVYIVKIRNQHEDLIAVFHGTAIRMA